ncbi:uncharacterized protein BDCG_17482, partial [Blastomyces dermatitidis ER-3]
NLKIPNVSSPPGPVQSRQGRAPFPSLPSGASCYKANSFSLQPQLRKRRASLVSRLVLELGCGVKLPPQRCTGLLLVLLLKGFSTKRNRTAAMLGLHATFNFGVILLF